MPIDGLLDKMRNNLANNLNKFKGKANNIETRSDISRSINNILKEMTCKGLFDEKLSFKVTGEGKEATIAPLFDEREIIIYGRYNNMEDMIAFLAQLNEHNVIYADEIEDTETITTKSFLIDD